LPPSQARKQRGKSDLFIRLSGGHPQIFLLPSENKRCASAVDSETDDVSFASHASSKMNRFSDYLVITIRDNPIPDAARIFVCPAGAAPLAKEM
jgi:hypothetical protein